MGRVIPLYPEFFEDSHWAVPDEVVAEDRATHNESEVPQAPWLGASVPRSERPVALGEPQGEFPLRSETDTIGAASFEIGRSAVDAVAAYFPWHFFGDEWGIRVYERHFLGFASEIADSAACDLPDVAPFILRQVLHHEWTHFGWEVAATEFEDLLARPLYGDYCRFRYGEMTMIDDAQPLEEAAATWSEVVYARSARLPALRKPPGYLDAVRAVSANSPPGYCSFDICREIPEIVAEELAGLITNKAVTTPRWGDVDRREYQQVPLFWVGKSERLAEAVGLLPKVVAPPSVRIFERWLRAIGADIDPYRGSGSHRGFLWNGRRSFYETSGDRLSRKTAVNLARFFGLNGPHELFRHIQDGLIPAG